MKLILENWRRFLKEQDDATVPAKPGARKGLKPMDPADIKTPATMGSPPEAKKKEIPAVQLSDEIQIHNAKILFHYYESESSVRNVFSEGWGTFDTVDPYRDLPSAHARFLRRRHPWLSAGAAEPKEPVKKLINYMVANTPVFHNNKIVEYLGAGSFGFVVELDNDHALKIFIGSFDARNIDFGDWMDREAKSDVARYKGSQEKVFSGEGQAGELMIYDQGRIKIPFKKDWHYAEMQQIRTLSHWMRYVHKIDEGDPRAVKRFNIELDDEIEGLKYFADEVNEGENMSANFREKLGLDDDGQARFIDNSIKYLDKAYAKNLFDQIKEILKTKSLIDIRDIRAANIGVSQQDESLPIIFDY